MLVEPKVRHVLSKQRKPLFQKSFGRRGILGEQSVLDGGNCGTLLVRSSAVWEGGDGGKCGGMGGVESGLRWTGRRSLLCGGGRVRYESAPRGVLGKAKVKVRALRAVPEVRDGSGGVRCGGGLPAVGSGGEDAWPGSSTAGDPTQYLGNTAAGVAEAREGPEVAVQDT
ncbi:hypothetical protein FIBSPDRAFT_882103 [Athelia psychrophila]|uniref:Uncharacterized protein n=1 Tax=Athelia psychrophila TaxID=1759441 RepID=A0A166VHZ3_9AGAM|nr:hypothetical protein FIBSPDRAFT_882103 [Fibularhizoctonia sp. CBS 109695]